MRFRNMTITKGEILKIGKLCAIKLSEKDIEYYEIELNKVLGWFEQLQEVDTENIQPVASVITLLPELAPDLVRKYGLKFPNQVDSVNGSSIACEKFAALPKREDKVTEGDLRSQILENAPDHYSGYFVVPKVVK